MNAPARTGVASLEVIQEKYSIRTQALVLAALGAVSFIFSVATTALVNQAFDGQYTPGDFVWLTIISILTVIAFGYFIWREGDGARSTQFAPSVWYLVVLIIYAIMWFGAAIGPVAITGYNYGVVLYCSRIIGTFAVCALADVTEALAWVIFVLHIVAILAVVGQGQKYASFKSGAGNIPLANVQGVPAPQFSQTPPPATYDGRVFTPPPEGFTGMYTPPGGNGTPMGTAGTPPPQFPQYENNAYAPPTPSQGYTALPTQQTPTQGYSTLPPPQGYVPSTPTQGYSTLPPPQGYAPSTPTQGYSTLPPPQGYVPPTPTQDFAPSPPPQGYSPQGYGGNTYTPPQGQQEYNQGNVYVPQSPNMYNQNSGVPSQPQNAYSGIPAQPPNVYTQNSGVPAQPPHTYSQSSSVPAQTPNAFENSQ